MWVTDRFFIFVWTILLIFNLTYSSNQVSPGAPGFLDHSHRFSVLAFRFALRLLRDGWSKGMEGGIEEAHRRERERDGIGISVVLMKWCCSSQKTYTQTYYQMVSAGGSSTPHPPKLFFSCSLFSPVYSRDYGLLISLNHNKFRLDSVLFLEPSLYPTHVLTDHVTLIENWLKRLTTVPDSKNIRVMI